MIGVTLFSIFLTPGMGLDLLGGLFLAHDLFGRRQGPLRTLLRAVLYCFIFVAVFSIALDWRFSLVAGIGLGLTFTYELGRRDSAGEGVAAPQEPREFFSLKRQQISLALSRGSFLGAGAAWAFSINFGLLFGLLTVTAMLFAYGLGFSPQFWSLTIYDVSTRTLIANKEQIADRSSRMQLVKNANGSVDLYVGPKAPSGFEKNWIPTVPGKAWFAYFRLYAPTEAHFNHTWTLPDFEEAR